jgi:hypothetical protein
MVRPAGFLFEGDTTMTAITVTVPPEVLSRIDELRQLEFLSRTAWLRREIVLAVRSNDQVAVTKPEQRVPA